ncbi:2'-5' RNA ligase family protein [Natrialba asiatica]|uniref:Phosphoesterase HXTX n=1 Tax=Natrialba asiatica (strain ATCC 700177 / DSM 12278 / JCM 9576 / FERM P-10747 / NBRC 102637 / 172P1) TaxID=29540 RepID=M0AHT6_NATA1|nr:2'-5' RNA ligase family protein [Natrialba asiatica]ELY98104.1 Phosphoesterase HXTX [Natrialba asiatica DSM 12278]
MYSVIAPVPGRVRKLATDLHPELVAFEHVRRTHSCLLKRLGDASRTHLTHLQRRTHRALENTAAVDATITGIDYFDDPPIGSAPVVYLSVDSPGLEAIHSQLIEIFDPVDDLEGDDYVPHITLARGGDTATARRLADREIDPITWTVTELEFWNGTEKVPASRVPLSSQSL